MLRKLIVVMSMVLTTVLHISCSGVSVIDGEPLPPTGKDLEVDWVEVTTPSITAAPNKGYLVNSDSLVSITLPTTIEVGDIIEITGIGLGGWKIIQSDSQTIIDPENPDFIGHYWEARATNRNWSAISASSDGSKLIASVDNGQLYTSTDAGLSWTPRAVNAKWVDVASSADGTKLVAIVQNGQIYTSIDSGVTWTARDSSRNWSRISSSADGSTLLASVSTGQLYVSTNFGVNWTPRDSNRYWYCVDISADGKTMAAGVNEYMGANNYVYTSTSTGLSWTLRNFYGALWSNIRISANGAVMVANAWYSGSGVYVSTDYGVTWNICLPPLMYRGIALSDDGSRIFVAHDSQAYLSCDTGKTWRVMDITCDTFRLAHSDDLTRLYCAVNSGGRIYTSIPQTTPGSQGYVIGNQFESIRLQYIGNNRYLVKFHEGKLEVN